MSTDPLVERDSDGRARGWVSAGAVLVYFRCSDSLRVDDNFRAPWAGAVLAWTVNVDGIPVAALAVEEGWQDGAKIVWIHQKGMLSSTVGFLSGGGVPINAKRSEMSCLRRNVMGTHLCGLATELAACRGFAAHLASSHWAMPGLAKIFIDLDCELERVLAARELTPFVQVDARTPVVSRLDGARAGNVVVYLLFMGLPLQKSAAAVYTPCTGPGCIGRSGRPCRSQALERTEQLATEPNLFDASRSADALQSAELRRTQQAELQALWLESNTFATFHHA